MLSTAHAMAAMAARPPIFFDGSRGAREFHRPCLTHGRQGQWANVQAEHRTL